MHKPLRRQFRWLELLVSVALMGGCATAPLQHRDLVHAEAGYAPSTELSEVPFHVQEAYHCGPASLVHADELAAARRRGLLPYVHQPRFSVLLKELDAGIPVLVLKNLAFEHFPIWHYAVVIGYDRERRNVILRSGAEPKSTDIRPALRITLPRLGFCY